MKISARNVLNGTVKAITPGVVNTEVVIITAKGKEVVSIIPQALSPEYLVDYVGDIVESSFLNDQ